MHLCVLELPMVTRLETWIDDGHAIWSAFGLIDEHLMQQLIWIGEFGRRHDRELVLGAARRVTSIGGVAVSLGRN